MSLFQAKMRWRTYGNILSNCVCDLRYDKGVEQEYLKNGSLPDLYAITVNFNGQKYQIYINNRVQVVDIFKKLIELKKLKADDVDDAYLVTKNGENVKDKFQLNDTIKTGLSDYNLFIEKRARSKNFIQIFVKALTGNTMTFEVDRQDTIGLIKGKIFIRYSIPIQQQQLLFSGKKLEDKSTLIDAGIESENSLHLCLQNDTGK